MPKKAQKRESVHEHVSTYSTSAQNQRPAERHPSHQIQTPQLLSQKNKHAVRSFLPSIQF